MSENASRLNVVPHKDVYVVEFLDNRILDELNIAEIGQALTVLLSSRERPKLLIDFANVDHLSSAALGMLINVDKRIKEKNGQLRLTNIKPQILEVFKITRLDRLFRIYGERNAGLGSFE